MSLFRRERRAWGDSLADVLELARGPRTSAGVPVDDDQALRLGAVWSCVDLLAELVSTLPIDEYRRQGRVPVPQRRPPLLDDPAGDGTGFEVWANQAMRSLLLRGNLFGFIVALGGDGWPTQIEVLHPDRVSVRRQLNFGPVDWFLDQKPIDRWPLGPLWHVPAYVMPGSPLGLSPIAYAAETIGLGLATRRFGAQWFGDGAHPTSIFESDHEIDEPQAKLIKNRIVKSLDNNREPLVLGAGGRLRSIQVNPEESQFLETSKANADDVARFFFRRPPGEGGQVTYANVEARSLDLLTYTVNGWLVRLERALTRLRPRPRYVKFKADALVRTDLITRYKAHDLAIRDGWKSRDEVRELEDLAPIPGGDEHLWPPYNTTPDGGDDDRPTEPAGTG